jgi:type IV pilus assembly protein PilW
MFLNINRTLKLPNIVLTKQSGFGLIEVMIAMTLGLLILAGISQYYISGNRTDVTTQALNQITDNARFISNKLGREVRMAAYTGPMQIASTNLLTASAASQLAYDLSVGITGFDNVTSAAMTTALSDHLASAQPIANTDIVIFRTTQDVQPVLLAADSTASNVTIQNVTNSSRGCSSGLPVSGICTSDLLLISDYRKAFFFQASAITSGGVITHTATGTPGNGTTSWTETFTKVSEVIPYQTVTYFLANGANNRPALFRKENAATAVELIPDVANFQVTYGVDTTGDKSVDGSYIAGGAVTNWSNVLSVHFSLLLASQNDGIVDSPMHVSAPAFPDNTTTATDRRLYKSLTFTAALRNRIQ